MTYNFLIALIIICTGCLSSCSSQSKQDSKLICLAKPVINEEHVLKIPNGVISLNLIKVFEIEKKPFLFAYFYPKSSIYVYDLTLDSLYKEIQIKDYSNLNNIEFFNNDSIMLYGSCNNNSNDSAIRCININGTIKKVYPLYHPYLISSKHPIRKEASIKKGIIYPHAQFIHDNKIFITFDYPYYGTMGYHCKYPIVGYYDLIKDSLFMNQNIWYPDIDDSRYYSPYLYYKHSITLLENGNILISFSHTPKLIEWDYKTNVLKKHYIDSKFSTSILFANKIQNDASSYENFNTDYGLYIPDICFIKDSNSRIYYRELFLPSLKYGENIILRVFFDANFNYLGEMIVEGDYFYNVYNNQHFSCNLNKGRLIFRFLRPTFAKFEEKELKLKLDSFAKNEIMRKKDVKYDLCNITENKTNTFTYEKNDILKYLKKAHQINDTSYSIAILNKNGCAPCNQHVLQFIKMNQTTFFNIKTRPMYLLYVDEKGSIDDIEAFLDGYLLFDKSHVKKDISALYSNFHPFTDMNPRLVLVSNNKVIHDNIYLPDDLSKFTEDLMNFYGFKTE